MIETNLIDKKQLHYTPVLLIHLPGQPLTTRELTAVATLEDARIQATRFLYNNEYLDESGIVWFAYGARIELHKEYKDEDGINVALMKEWEISVSEEVEDITADERKFIDLFPMANAEAPCWNAVYDASLAAVGEVIRVNANSMCDVLDEAVDYAEDRGWEGLFIDEETYDEYVREGWEDEIMYGGNAGRPMFSHEVYCTKIAKL